MTSLRSGISRLTHLFIFALMIAAASGAAQAIAATSPWVVGHKAKVRLLAGRPGTGSSGESMAFVEFLLEPGWKTYWRTPGDAGGLPPSFDWSKSSNLAAAEVAFPAPQRFTDKSGSTIGYRDSLVLPVTLKPLRAGEPISLVVGLHYGICKDICVPVEAELSLDVPPSGDDALPIEAQQALESLPRAQGNLRPSDPVLVASKVVLDGAASKITIEAKFPGGDAGADVFLEAPDGLYLPPAERVGDGSDPVVFEAALGRDVDLTQLRGKTITVTLVGETGASTATFSAE
ncbi:MAG: protein-disulfide reductase DsbD domain-containing protein [Hyphomicrobium sp.]|uniref:protein-disulfide reductase DsbD domain-containing protein n=1 Tax=Hyphomicrobium sp. TaxID=82 RepID=UPI003D14BA71